MGGGAGEGRCDVKCLAVKKGGEEEKKKHHERSVGCLAFNDASESFDSDFRMGKFYCARQRLELTVAQHSHRVADGIYMRRLHARLTVASKHHTQTKKSQRGSVIGLILCNARLHSCR